jgi:bla regulator protein blaR1
MNGLRRTSSGVGVLVSVAFHAVAIAVLLFAGVLSPARPALDSRTSRIAYDGAPRSAKEPPAPARRQQNDVAADGEPRERQADHAVPRSIAAPAAAAARRSVREPPRSEASGGAIAFPGNRTDVANNLLDHLWQSTLCAFAIGLLTLAFRRSDARVRYWLWWAASVKFLLPFSIFVALGSAMPWPSDGEPAAPSTISSTIVYVSEPFAEGRVLAPQRASVASGNTDWMGIAAFLVWFCGAELAVLLQWRAWRGVRAAVKASIPFAGRTTLSPGVEVRTASSLLEPGVVGFWRPVLLLPAGIDGHLSAEEFDAVVEHEACHITCRDNLTAAVQMLVEAVFWFHPLVWWIGGRLIRERERACDEHVLRAFANPRAYADGIVNVCKRYVDARLACVPGVSSSDLRQRIERIMKNETGEAVATWKKIALGIAAVVALVAPVAAGMRGAVAQGRAQSQAPAPRGADDARVAFQAASVKPNASGAVGTRLDPAEGGRFAATNATLSILMRFAYDLPEFRVAGGPAWLNTDRFDIVASADGTPSLAQKRLMLRALLDERFHVAAHTETRELPIYVLALARSDGRLGAGLRRSVAECGGSEPLGLLPGLAPSARNDAPSCGFFGFAPDTNLPSGKGGLAFRGLTMGGFAETLVAMVHRSVKDETGLVGYYDGNFDFVAELPPPPPPPGMPNPFTQPFISVFTSLPEQLGLTLNSSRGPVDVLVIDSAEHPTPD